MGKADLLDRAPELLDLVEGAPEDLQNAGVDPLARQLRRNAEAHPIEALLPRRLDPGRVLQRGRVTRVVTQHVPKQQGGVRDVARERAGLIER
jgi:hypothetical protein